jgi:hypothetical protein
MFMHSGLRKILLQTRSVEESPPQGTKVFMVHKFPVSECPALFNQQTAVINIYK